MRGDARRCCGRCSRAVSLPASIAPRCRGARFYRRSVTDVVQAGKEPTSVPPEILAAIREREELGAFDRLDPRQSLSLGNQVRVTADAFEDMVGRLVELRDHDRVVVLLGLLGRAVRAQLPAEAVEAA